MFRAFWNWLFGKKNPGISLYEVKIFKAAKRRPRAPKGGYYDFGKEVFKCPAGWSPIRPVGASTDTVWASQALFEVQGDRGRDSKPRWSKPVRA